ncbi:MAG TPA: CoA pyrophosphatase [Chloroflexia bacterium]|jgi:8-oxo-dGTP pyrophosphatase MutT (NUDIX family)
MDTPQPTIFDDLKGPTDPNEEYRLASVLVLIYPRAGESYVVFMRRTDTVEHHKGQISLPGGGRDDTDPDPVYTALREAEEELGIDPSTVQVIGAMPDIYARVSSFLITPIVALLKPGTEDRLIFKPAPEEVAEVIEVPLRVFYDQSAHRTEIRTHNNVTYHIHFYTYGPYEVWGVTGRIMHEFTKLYPVDQIGNWNFELRI